MGWVLDEKKSYKKVSRKKVPSKKYIDYETENIDEIENHNYSKKVLGKRKYTKKLNKL